MLYVKGLTIAVGLAVLAAPRAGVFAQAQEGASKAVAGGGITAPGWMGQVDATEEKAGLAVKDTKFAAEGQNFHVTTGPATTYWNPSNVASGDYTVKASFNEPDYMGLNDHAHPYGVVIGINDAGTPNMTALYCAAYGNGTFIVRGFGPAPFSVSPRRATANEAVHKAEAQHKPVTQDIALSVKGDSVTCSINGTVVGTYAKADIVGPGKLKSLDGMYGIRFAHNTDGIVSGFSMTK